MKLYIRACRHTVTIRLQRKEPITEYSLVVRRDEHASAARVRLSYALEETRLNEMTRIVSVLVLRFNATLTAVVDLERVDDQFDRSRDFSKIAFPSGEKRDIERCDHEMERHSKRCID